MKTLVILGHPDPASFNHAIASRACETLHNNGHGVLFHDLFAEGFDPVLTKEEIPQDGAIPPLIQQHCEALRCAEGIVIVHPNWWGQPPAVLKGWIDRVFRPGVSYSFAEGDSGEGVPVGLLRTQAALVINTSNTTPGREQAAFGDPLEALWNRCIFSLCGVKNFHRRMFSVVVTSTPEQRRIWLEEVNDLVTATFGVVTPAAPHESGAA